LVCWYRPKPRPAKQPPAGSGWIHEIKHDGFRIMARRFEGRVRLLTRKGNDFSNRLARSTSDLLNVLDALANAGAAFRSLADPIEAE
jgi:ATP-dependent DNA ligase